MLHPPTKHINTYRTDPTPSLKPHWTDQNQNSHENNRQHSTNKTPPVTKHDQLSKETVENLTETTENIYICVWRTRATNTTMVKRWLKFVALAAAFCAVSLSLRPCLTSDSALTVAYHDFRGWAYPIFKTDYLKWFISGEGGRGDVLGFTTGIWTFMGINGYFWCYKKKRIFFIVNNMARL